jgi:hypothetical protein
VLSHSSNILPYWHLRVGLGCSPFFSAGTPGGLSKRIRVELGYDDAVKADSFVYTAGQITGTGLGLATSFANPCA